MHSDCRSCRFFAIVGEEDHDGIPTLKGKCHQKPPSGISQRQSHILHSPHNWTHPTVFATDWCGDWKGSIDDLLPEDDEQIGESDL